MNEMVMGLEHTPQKVVARSGAQFVPEQVSSSWENVTVIVCVHAVTGNATNVHIERDPSNLRRLSDVNNVVYSFLELAQTQNSPPVMIEQKIIIQHYVLCISANLNMQLNLPHFHVKCANILYIYLNCSVL